MRVATIGLLVLALSSVVPAVAEDFPCSASSGMYREIRPDEVNMRLFEKGELVSGSWTFTSANRHPEFGSFLALVLGSHEFDFTEIILEECPAPLLVCARIRSIIDGEAVAHRGAAITTYRMPSRFSLQRLDERKWAVRFGDRQFDLEPPHAVRWLELKCVGATGLFSFDGGKR